MRGEPVHGVLETTGFNRNGGEQKGMIKFLLQSVNHMVLCVQKENKIQIHASSINGVANTIKLTQIVRDVPEQLGMYYAIFFEITNLI